ncbi:hypothetical protein E2C01_034871 [Portunus trituberculatus]|uniref:Uncharacterized protein n=1 Tax=Portunus trituberculatus TaxID=210409 RepID=A0A5B7F864_PORTR|nr:hypothetical protein [Portunus trituberculatus]
MQPRPHPNLLTPNPSPHLPSSPAVIRVRVGRGEAMTGCLWRRGLVMGLSRANSQLAASVTTAEARTVMSRDGREVMVVWAIRVKIQVPYVRVVDEVVMTSLLTDNRTRYQRCPRCFMSYILRRGVKTVKKADYWVKRAARAHHYSTTLGRYRRGIL